jgi:S1-C subfamily serine protease
MNRRARLKVASASVAVTLAAVGLLVLVGSFGGDDDADRAAPALPALPRAIAQDGERINEIYRRSRDSVLFIQASIVQEQTSPFGPPGGQQGVSTGTGFLIDERGSVVTNAHVVESAREVAIRVGENSLVDAELVGSDPANDIALLRVDPADIDAPPLRLGDSDAVEVGDPVFALGNPLGLEDTITAGIVSAKQRRITAPNQSTIENVIQTDAAVNPGNSGGPLLDVDGRVIGVNSQIATAGQGSTGFIGIAFAVPVNTVKEIVPDLADDGEVERPVLGVTAVTVTPPLAQQLGLEVDRGALLVGVADGSAADRAGLRGGGTPSGALTGDGDVIVRIGDRDIASTEDLANAISDLRPGDTVQVEYVRDGERGTMRVRLTDAA